MNAAFPPNRLRQALAKGRAVFGPNLQLPSPELVEIIGLAGFDFVMLDGEHGAVWPRLPEMLRAAELVGLTAVVRVPSADRSVVMLPLELGAGGLQVPFVDTPEHAAAIVQLVKFPPLGGRGISGVSRAARHGFGDMGRYRNVANRETLLIAQIETADAARNAAAIAAVPGIDQIFIGPADLAQSLGEPADRLTPTTIRVIREIIRTVAPLKPVGVSAFKRGDVTRWHRAGARSFVTSSALPLRDAFRHVHSELRSGLPS